MTTDCLNTLRPRQNGRHFVDVPFKRNFLSETVRISINISLKFVTRGQINNIPALVQMMAWRRPGEKSLSELMLVSLLTHTRVTRPQWVNKLLNEQSGCRQWFEMRCINSHIMTLWYIAMGLPDFKHQWWSKWCFVARVFFITHLSWSIFI